MPNHREAWTEAVTKGTLGAARVPQVQRSKYGAVKVTVDGVTFASRREAARFHELKLLQKAGQLSDLTVHPAFELYVKPTNALREEHALGIRVGTYTADFRYIRDGVVVIEDVKSSATKTTAYQLRKRMVEAIYGIQIRET